MQGVNIQHILADGKRFAHRIRDRRFSRERCQTVQAVTRTAKRADQDYRGRLRR